MNVAASSIASPQPSAPPVPSGALTAPDAGTQTSFANAMQATQRQDSTQENAAAQPKIKTIATDTPAAAPAASTLDSLTAIAPSIPKRSLAPIQSAAPKIAKTATATPGGIAAVDEASTSSDATDVFSAASAQDATIALEQNSKPRSSSSLSAIEAAASQTDGERLQQSAATIVSMAPDVSTAAGIAPVAPNPLIAKKPDTRAVATTAAKSPVKNAHTPEAGGGKPATPQPLPAADVHGIWKTGELHAAALLPHENLTDNEAQAAADTASVPATTVLTAAASPTPHAGLAAKVSAANASDASNWNGESTPAVQSLAGTPADLQVAGVHDAAAVQNSATPPIAAQGPSTEQRADASFTQNLFAAATALSPNALQAAAVFVPSLTTQAATTGEHRTSSAVAADLSNAVSRSVLDGMPDRAMAQSAPVRRLEVAVNDPLLGNIDVRAEMRGGALHASVIGTQDTAAASMPALHQFLQQHDVTVHTLTYTTTGAGVVATGSTTPGSSDMGRDSTGRNSAGSAGSGSQQPQGDGSQPQRERYGTADSYFDEHLFATAQSSRSAGPSGAAVSTSLLTGSTLSIHI